MTHRDKKNKKKHSSSSSSSSSNKKKYKNVHKKKSSSSSSSSSSNKKRKQKGKYAEPQHYQQHYGQAPGQPQPYVYQPGQQQVQGHQQPYVYQPGQQQVQGHQQPYVYQPGQPASPAYPQHAAPAMPVHQPNVVPVVDKLHHADYSVVYNPDPHKPASSPQAYAATQVLAPVYAPQVDKKKKVRDPNETLDCLLPHVEARSSSDEPVKDLRLIDGFQTVAAPAKENAPNNYAEKKKANQEQADKLRAMRNNYKI